MPWGGGGTEEPRDRGRWRQHPRVMLYLGAKQGARWIAGFAAAVH